MVLLGLAGMPFDTGAVRFEPCVPEGISSIGLKNVRCRNAICDVAIHGTRTKVTHCPVNGKSADEPMIPAEATGCQAVAITVAR